MTPPRSVKGCSDAGQSECAGRRAASKKRKAKDVVEQANAAMREAKRLQAEANAKYAEAEAVLSRFGLADVPPQPTPPQRARRPLNQGVRAMSAYQANVKVEPPCVARSARTPGSIVSSSTTFGMRGVAPAPHSSALRARPYRTGSLLTREGNHVFGNEQPKVARDMLVQGAAPGR